MTDKIHSFLFVPANEKMLSKIPTCSADAVIIDLEDAVLETHKDEALFLVKKYLDKNKINIPIFVRINPDRVEREISLLKGTKISGYMIPKSETVEDIEIVNNFDNDKKIIALVETPMGIVNVPELAKCELVYGIAFGAEDYTARCDINNVNENLLYQKSRIVNYAKAFGKVAIDTISLNIHDKDSYKKEVQKSKDLGFDAKLAIHPMQVEAINELYTNRDYDYLKNIVDTYISSGRSVLEIEGKVYEKPHIDAIIKELRNMDG